MIELLSCTFLVSESCEKEVIFSLRLKIYHLSKIQLYRALEGLSAKEHTCCIRCGKPLQIVGIVVEALKNHLILIIRDDIDAILPYILIRSNGDSSGDSIHIEIDINVAIQRLRLLDDDVLAGEPSCPVLVLIAAAVVNLYGTKTPWHETATR